MINKRIIILAESIPPNYSGAGKRAARHALYLNNKSMLNSIITNSNYNSAAGKLPYNRVKSIETKGFFNNGFIAVLFFNIRVYYFLYKNKSHFDIIHSFIDTYNCLGALLFCKMFKKKLIVEFTLLPENGSGKIRYSNIIRKLIFKKSDQIVCVSDALSQWCIKNKIPKNSIRVIQNDTDLEMKNVDVNGEENSKRSPIVLFVGPATFRKGFDIVIETFKILQVEISDIVLIWIGPRNIKFDNKNLPKNFNSLGMVENVSDYYNMADVTIFPSRREGFGNVIIESMACGTPVVASLLEGITDTIITNRIDGLLVKGEDPIEYAKAILLLLTNEKYYSELKSAGMATINKRFRTDTVMQNYIELYISVG